ncbi:MAG: hypothetical protein GY841_08570, partial [FCB group bacterium]|nr:hypothetical protein [FCB group bacterium]
MRSIGTSTLMTIMLSIILSVAGSAEIPHLITYQGRLTDPAGNPVNDSSYQVTFTIYNLPDAGDVLWTSGVQDIDVGDGLFSYPLGIHVPLHDSVFTQNMELWLGVKVGADPEMTPRPMLTSGPYVYQSLKANMADFAEAAGFTEHAVHADTAEYAHAGPSGGLTLPYSGTTANAATAFAVSNTGSGSGPALRGSSDEN